MSSRSRGVKMPTRSYPFSKKVMQTIAQLLLVFLLFPIAMCLLAWIVPGSAQDAFFNMLGEVPFVSEIANFAQAIGFVDMAPDTILIEYGNLITRVGNYAFEAFFVACSIIVAEEFDTMIGFNKGASVLAVFFGSVYGAGICALVKYFGVNLMGKLMLTLVIFALSLFIMIINSVIVSPISGAWNVIRPILVRYFTAGFSALVGMYSIFFICCVLSFAKYKMYTWEMIHQLLILPTVAELFFIVVDVLLYLAARGVKK